MKPPLRPAGEARRLELLRLYDVLDTLPEQALDDLTALAGYICAAPISLISFVDEERQWFTSRAGFLVRGTSRDASFCGHAILASDVFVIPDTTNDDRFADNPLVTDDPRIRFYAGAPLFTPEGEALGTLCVMDRVPRELTRDQLEAMRALSRQVVAQLQLRRHTRRLIDSSDNAIIGKDLTGIARDITERRRTDQARRASDSRYRALFDHAPDGILIADAESHYVDANPAICRMLGYSREELIHLHARDIVARRETEYLVPALSAIKSKADCNREWQFRRKDGSLFTAEVIGATMPDGNLLSVVRDLTERKKLEQQFFRAQRMESIGTLAGGIAHDLNNVLAPILLSVALMKDATQDEESLELLDTVQGCAQRGADLVRQVLSFARGVEGCRVTVNLLHLMRDLLKTMRETFPRSITVRFDSPRDLWTVMGDATQMHQVFLNLCLNARDAMPTGGRLTVSMETVVLDETYAAMNIDACAGVYIVVSVADTGAGIPTAIRDRIFEPFFTTKDIGKGTGLGLSTSLAIVKSHGGFIHVCSELGQGTTFKVYLPANANATGANEIVVERRRLPRGQGELVMVVDDEPAIRTIAQVTLERFGYRVILAANGAEAVALYATRRSEIAVVLTDMAMPVMDGPATIVALRSIDPSVQIIASSGLTSHDGVSKAVGVGVQHFVAKPYTAETLLRILRLVLHEGQST